MRLSGVKRVKQAALGATLALVLSPAPAVRAEPATWPQTRSDRPANPAVTFGVLPNGMRYAIMRNATPAGGASLRLRIGAGSLYESDSQQGVAHFLEHMAFRGSTHVASGEALRMLERLGLAPGADANAFTGLTQTVYKFDVPSATEAKLDTALMLLRETAGELSLSDASFEAERPVILSEERGGAGPARDAGAAQSALLFKGQRAGDRLPIGKPDLLKTMPVAEARRFYRDYYRPERATLVVVGDIDPASVEAKIRARFADWRNPAPAAPDPDFGRPTATGPAARIMVAPGVRAQLSLAWERPYDDSPHDLARQRRDTIEQMAMNILSRRIYSLAASANSPFTAGGAAVQNVVRSGRVTLLQAMIRPGDWQRALQGLVVAKRQITAPSGVSQADLDTAIVSIRSQLQTRAASFDTRPSGTLADEFIFATDQDDVFTADSYDLDQFEAMVKTITPDEVAAAARAAFAGPGPLIFLASPVPVPEGEKGLLAALAEAGTISTSSIQVSAKAWPYSHFGTPGKVAERRQVADLDVTQLRFANGVRLNVKSTKLLADQVLVQVRFGNGRMGLPKRLPPVDWALGAWLAGGIKGLSLAEREQIFAGKVHRESANVADDAFLLGAVTRPQDFELELQLLTAYMTAPAWNSDQFERFRSVAAGSLPQLETTPRGVMQRELGQLIHSGDPRWRLPTPAEAQALKLEDVRAFVDPALASAPVEVTVVGDVTVDRAIESVAATFGTLSPRPAPVRRPDHVAFPAPSPTPVTLRHGGRADQGLALTAWPIPDYYADPQAARALDLLARVVSQRLFDQVRVAQGATYSTAANASSSNIFPGYGFFLAFAETPPDKVQGFYRTLDGIVADLKAKEIDADELARARTPVLEQIATAQRNNAFWLTRLSGSQADPRQLDSIRTLRSGIEAITAADLRRRAQTYLDPARLWRLQILPNAPAPAALPQ